MPKLHDFMEKTVEEKERRERDVQIEKEQVCIYIEPRSEVICIKLSSIWEQTDISTWVYYLLEDEDIDRGLIQEFIKVASEQMGMSDPYERLEKLLA